MFSADGTYTGRRYYTSHSDQESPSLNGSSQSEETTSHSLSEGTPPSLTEDVSFTDSSTSHSLTEDVSLTDTSISHSLKDGSTPGEDENVQVSVVGSPEDISSEGNTEILSSAAAKQISKVIGTPQSLSEFDNANIGHLQLKSTTTTKP